MREQQEEDQRHLKWFTHGFTIASVIAFWVLFDQSGHSFLFLVANSLLLVLVTILFSWAKSTALLNRPLPPIPNLEISEGSVGRKAAEARMWINRVLSVVSCIAIERYRKVFMEVFMVLLVVESH